jgi:alpha-beta hydrolase superfamily lysophospholipase
VSDRTLNLAGSEGAIEAHVWSNPNPERIVVIAHGYGEHMGRYEHVARLLTERGAVVYGPDHIGHGTSEGERALVKDFESVVDDLHTVVGLARETHPGLPVVLIGHSMGGMIAMRYAQRHGDGLAGLVISAPVAGLGEVFRQWLSMPELPNDPIDVDVLSRDPKVGEAYAADPLVYHEGWKRPTLEAFAAANEAIAAGPDFGDLPTYYVHGDADALVPMIAARPAVEAKQGTDFTERIVPGARHEVFNETDKDETLAEVAAFVERVTAA